jgi:hypothetical protein
MKMNLHKLILVFMVCIMPVLLFPQQNQSQMLLKTHETVGLTFQMQSISPDAGDSKAYTLLAVPIQARYEYSRYLTFNMLFNHGYQSFDGTGLYGLGDLHLSGQYLYREDITFVGGITLPIGTKKLEYEKLTATSAGRLPFVNAPIVCGMSGFGINFGASYGSQVNEETSIALGALYRMRGTYKPIKDGSDYNPSDEFMLAAGVDYGDEETLGFFGDLQLSFYTEEKINGEKYADPGMGFALNGKLYINRFNLTLLYYHRGESDLGYAGDFKPPSIFSLKLGHKDAWSYLPFGSTLPVLPYIGFTKTGEGTLVDAATLFLLGACLEDFKLNGYPLRPFIEINFGSIGDDASTFGLKIGTDVSFQIY